jgi:transposase
MTGLRLVTDDQQLAVLRILARPPQAPGEDHRRMVCQLHQLLLELIPGGAHKSLSAAQAKVLRAKSVRAMRSAGRGGGSRPSLSATWSAPASARKSPVRS